MPAKTIFLAAIAALANFSSASLDSTIEKINLADYKCTHPPYKIHLISKSPSVIYITNFISATERAHLLRIAGPTFTRSLATPGATSNDTTTTSSGHRSALRTSFSTSLSGTDPVVSCITARAQLFQGGFVPSAAHIEPLQLVRYGPGQRFHYHTDWFPPAVSADGNNEEGSGGDGGGDDGAISWSAGGNRISSFFAYVGVSGTQGSWDTVAASELTTHPSESKDGAARYYADAVNHTYSAAEGGGGISFEKVTGGGTNFPILSFPRPETAGDETLKLKAGSNHAAASGIVDWCADLIDCDEPHENGVTFLPVEGNAVYWENMLVTSGGMTAALGSKVGDQRTLHAGLPVTSGQKVGMNIWTREAPLRAELRGQL